MKKKQNISIILLLILIISGSAFVLGQNRPGAGDVSVKMANNADQPLYLAVAKAKDNNQKTSAAVNEDNEETVLINVSNYGRSNPFKPFVEKSLLMTVPTIKVPQINVPQPPEYNPDPNFSTLFGIKVSGILYDASRPSAIINVDKSDYLVHKGDFLFNFYVKDITADKIAIKYGNNTYKAGIGEIIEGIVNINPVSRHKMSGFSGPSSYTGPTSSASGINLVNPVDLPTLPTLR